MDPGGLLFGKGPLKSVTWGHFQGPFGLMKVQVFENCLEGGWWLSGGCLKGSGGGPKGVWRESMGCPNGMWGV